MPTGITTRWSACPSSGNGSSTKDPHGATWAKWPGLPTTHYDDIVIHPREKDLVLGIHGRSIWIVDDTRPLAEWTPAVAAGPAHLFSVRQATIFTYWKDTSYRGQAEFAGENPVSGAIISYKLGAGSGDALLSVARANGEVIREYRVPDGEGMHRVNWDLRHPAGLDMGAETWLAFEDDLLPRSVDDQGHFVSPGSYTVTLAARGTGSGRRHPDPPSLGAPFPGIGVL